MQLSPGARLGPYEVVAALGAGGMGEVYRARDTRLKRDVALKILPDRFATDPERMARFEREAELLAALDHPHIAAIYGIEESGSTRALVLPFIEGETLAERLQRGAIPVDDALAIGRQIADALEAAHDQGIVHRDLKPGNIKVTPDGQVKVLDFGLAKALAGDAPDDGSSRHATAGSASASPTVMSPATLTGVAVLLGTAAYMSPEQAKGVAADKRSDVWAFGCVLFEMLCGRAAFRRDTVAETLAAVLESEPDWRLLPQALPPEVRRLLEKCLARDVRRRLRSIGDARLELEDLPRDVSMSTARHARGVGWAVLSVIGVAAAAAAIWWVSRANGPGETPPAAVIRYTVTLPAGERFEAPVAGLPNVVAISPDGRQIVYTSRSARGNRLFRRGRDELEATPIPGTDGGFGPFFSPDGQWVGFVVGDALRKVPIAGGASQMIAPAINVLGASWGSDDTIAWGQWNGGLFRVAANGGPVQPLTTLAREQGEIRHGSPRFMPDGRAVLFSIYYGDAPAAVGVVDLASGRRSVVLEGDGPYVSRGRLLLSRGGTLFAVPFDSARLAAAGEPVRVLDGVAAGGQPQFAVAGDGTLVYVPSALNQPRRLVWVDRAGRSSTVVADQERFSHPRLSPDGSRVLVQVTGGAANEFLVYDVQRGSRTRLTVRGSRPVWEQGATRITFQKDQDLYSVPADDSRAPERLVAREPPASALFPLAWSSDGTTLVFSRPAPQTNRDVFTMRRGERPVPFLTTPRDERSAMLSPDGRWMVYAARDVGREEEIYVQPFPSGDMRVVVSAGGGIEPVWSPAGNEIFYRSSDGRRMFAVPVATSPTFRIGMPRPLFEGRFLLGASFWADYDVTRDGMRFLMLEADDSSDSQLNVTVNWIDSLNQAAGLARR